VLAGVGILIPLTARQSLRLQLLGLGIALGPVLLRLGPGDGLALLTHGLVSGHHRRGGRGGRCRPAADQHLLAHRGASGSVSRLSSSTETQVSGVDSSCRQPRRAFQVDEPDAAGPPRPGRGARAAQGVLVVGARHGHHGDVTRYEAVVSRARPVPWPQAQQHGTQRDAQTSSCNRSDWRAVSGMRMPTPASTAMLEVR